MNQHFIILDVGSGSESSFFNILLKGNNILHLDINRGAFSLDILASAEYLPFRDNTFKFVHASHILEHLKNPFQALTDFKRVSSETVLIKVPNASRTFRQESPEHLYTWNQYSLFSLLSEVFETVEICEIERLSRKTRLNRIKSLIYTALYRPSELSATCQVKELRS